MNSAKRILIAEDDPEVVGSLEPWLKKAGYEVTVAVNGSLALKAAESRRFDLALIDVMMPNIDGYHTAELISSRLGEAAPKIIIMTSRDLAAERGIALLSGAVDALQKPFTLEELDAKIRSALAL